MKKILISLVALILSSSSFALVTAYASFDHPEGWRCELSQGVWICQSTAEPDRKESVVLSIGTLATEWDTLDNYEEYLKQPRTLQDEEGNSLTSKITYVRKRNINGHQWVDSLQLNSELPGFWARYLATTHNKLAILITYIVSEERYQQLAPQFERMVSSLRTNADFNINVASKQGDGPLPGGTKLGPLQKSILAERLSPRKKGDKKQDTEAEGESGSSPFKLALVLGACAAIVVVIWRRRQSSKSEKKTRPPSGPTT